MSLPNRKYYEHYEKLASADAPTLTRVYCCPCCDYPTVGEPPSYDVCFVCDWEDDDCAGGGPNGGYSLEEARQNFRKYLTMYRADEDCDPRLKRFGYKTIHDFELRPHELERKKRVMALLDQYMAEPDLYRRGEIWDKIWHAD